MNDSNLVVMTTATAKPEKEHELQQALQGVAETARTQPGCIDYRIFRSAEDPAVTINYERWSSAEARDAFNAGPAVEKFSAAVSGAFAAPPQPVVYHEIG